MVLESVENVIFFLVNLSATIAAGTGMVVLQSFFKNKLKDLFNDVNYFIFFFMVSGYILYALGEVSYYLTRQVFKNTSAIGVHDVYWTIGGILILLSFAALAFTLFKEHGGTGKFSLMLIVGIILLVLVLAIVLGVIGPRSDYFFGVFYPVISSLIITAALSVILFYNELGGLGLPLLLLFLASSCILVGDISFHYTAAQLTSGLLSLIQDIFYLVGYGLSAVAFMSLRLHLHRAAE